MFFPASAWAIPAAHVSRNPTGDVSSSYSDRNPCLAARISVSSGGVERSLLEAIETPAPSAMVDKVASGSDAGYDEDEDDEDDEDEVYGVQT